jgi:hypothetical protein
VLAVASALQAVLASPLGTKQLRVLTKNTAISAGGVYLAGTGVVRNCVFIMNSAVLGDGGGVYCMNGSVLESSTVVSNTAAISGGGICCDSGGTVMNTISYFNQATSNANIHTVSNGWTITYSCSAEIFSEGNVTNDPELVNVGGGDWHLSAGSPCINAGTNLDWMLTATDLDGYPRIFPTGGIVDIGADEGVPEPILLPAFLVLIASRRLRMQLR